MGLVGLNRSAKLTGKYGIKVVPSFYIKDEKEAASIAKNLEYPLVLKVYAPGFMHKHAAGLVRTNISNEGQLGEQYKLLMTTIKKYYIKKCEMVLQRQIQGTEYILGAKQDETFGEIVLFGLGGVNAELLKKVAIRISPLSRSMADEMIREVNPQIEKDTSRIFTMLSELLLKVSKLAEKEHIAELDLNPVIVNAAGLHIVDVRIIK